MGAKHLAWWLVILGAINLGLVGLGSLLGAQLNIINLIFGGFAGVEALILVLIGLSGVWLLWDKLGKK